MSETCPVCSSSDTRVKYKTKLCSIFLCKECGHLFTPTAHIVDDETYSSKYYEEDHKNWFNNPHFEMFDLIASDISLYQQKCLSSDVSVVDIGCGQFELLKYLRGKFDSIKLTGVDLAPESILPPQGIDFVNSSFSEFSTNIQFDIVVSTLTIEHIDDPIAFFNKSASLLKPGGRLLVVTNDCSSPLYLASRALRKLNITKPLERLYHPHHLNHFTKSALATAAEKSNLKLSSQKSLSIPFKCLDIPVSGLLESLVFPPAVRALLFLGRFTNHQFLQYIVCNN